MAQKDTDSGAASALGYVYQAQRGLLELLRRGVTKPGLSVSVELFDDVAWDDGDTAAIRLQSKYRPLSRRSLSDSSPDLWKTIGNWIKQGEAADPDGAELWLMTTETAAPDSAAALVRAEERRADQALTRLEEVARSGRNDETKDARAAFLALPAAQRSGLVYRIVIFDNEPHLAELNQLIINELGTSMPYGHENVFLEIVAGWWSERVLAMLERRESGVNHEQLRQAISERRDDFGPDRLPTAPGTRAAYSDQRREELQAKYAAATFVRRLNDIDYPRRALQVAVLDYYRAVTARTFWLDRGLLTRSDISWFEQQLHEEWVVEFERTCMALADDASEAQKREAGRELLHGLLANTDIRIRNGVEDLFVAKGSRHDLADRNIVVWHPDFEHEVEQLLGIA